MDLIDSNEKKYYKDLLGLFFSEPDAIECQYVHSFSFDKDILNNFIINNIKDEEKNLYSIKKIKIYKYVIPTSKINNIGGFYIPLDNDKFINDKLYGYNLIINGLCEQVLLSTNIITDRMKKDGISIIPLNIDTFYEESILNAY